MKTVAKIVLSLVTLAPAFGASRAAPASPWTLTEGLSAPESVYRDPASDRLFVSNVVGAAGDKDGQGFVAEIVFTQGQPSLKVLVSGLNAPKGLRAQNGTLYVTDIDQVVTIDLATNTLKQKIGVPGSTFLNDLAIAADGKVYVSDMIASRIYVLEGDDVSLFAAGEDLESPNGLLVQGDQLIVAAWGFITDPATFGVKTVGHLYALDLKTKAKTLITAAPLGNLDGLEATKDGYLATDWVAGKLYRINQAGEATLLLEGLKNPADIGLSGSTLYIPEMGGNQVTTLEL